MTAAPRRRWWLAALLGGFVAGALAHLPLRLAVAASGAAPALREARLDGSIWRWRATLPQGIELEFIATPSRLLLGRYAGELSAAHEGAWFSGMASRAVGGAIELDDGEIEADLAPLARALGMPPSALGGTLRASGLRIAWRDGRFTAFACAGGVEGLRASDGTEALDLGELEIGCALDQGGPAVDIVDRGGPLALRARVVLSMDGRFLLEGTAGARPDAPPELAQVLPLLGRQSGPDQVSFRYAGALPR